MMKLAFSSTAAALVLALPAMASAQSAQANGTSSCPPGSWFCAAPPEGPTTPAGPSVPGATSHALKPLPDPDPIESAAPASTPNAASELPAPATSPTTQPPPPAEYAPPPRASVRPEAPPPYAYAPPWREPISAPSEWGLNLHLEGAMIGRGSQNDTSMGGGGFGLRFKPSRYFGLEGDLDFIGGHDYQDNERDETAFTLNALVFLNPGSRAQVYLLAGFGWSGAHVQGDATATRGLLDTTYDYFGGQAGLGLELRLTRVLAFNIDGRGFLRGRTDDLAQTQPEFSKVDAYGNTITTNTSGGGMLTGGMTLYF